MAKRGEDKPLLVNLLDSGRGNKGSDDEAYIEAKYGQSTSMIKRWKYGAKNGNGRAKSVIMGAASVINKWPDHLTLCWLFAVAFFMMVITFILVMESSKHTVPQSFTALSIQKKCIARHESIIKNNHQKYPDKTNIYLHVILNGKETFNTKKHKDLFASVIQRHPNHFINVYVLYNDTTEIGYKRNSRFKDWELYQNTFDEPRFFETSSADEKHGSIIPFHAQRDAAGIIDFENVNIVRSSLSSYFLHSPLRFRWRILPDSLIPFILRVLTLWEHGGITMPWQLFKDKTDIYCVKKDVQGQIQDLMGGLNKKNLFDNNVPTTRMTRQQIVEEIQTYVDLGDGLTIETGSKMREMEDEQMRQLNLKAMEDEQMRQLNLNKMEGEQMRQLNLNKMEDEQVHQLNLKEIELEQMRQLNLKKLEDERMRQLNLKAMEDEQMRQLNLKEMEDEQMRQLNLKEMELEQMRQLNMKILEDERMRQMKLREMEDEQLRQLDLDKLDDEQLRQLNLKKIKDEQMRRLKLKELENEQMRQLNLKIMEIEQMRQLSVNKIENEPMRQFNLNDTKIDTPVSPNPNRNKLPRETMDKLKDKREMAKLLRGNKPGDYHSSSRRSVGIHGSHDDESPSSSSSSSSSSAHNKYIKKLKQKLLEDQHESKDLSSTEARIKEMLQNPQLRKRLEKVNVENMMAKDSRLRRIKRDLQIQSKLNTLPPPKSSAVRLKTNLTDKLKAVRPRYGHMRTRSSEWSSTRSVDTSSYYDSSEYYDSYSSSYSGYVALKPFKPNQRRRNALIQNQLQWPPSSDSMFKRRMARSMGSSSSSSASVKNTLGGISSSVSDSSFSISEHYHKEKKAYVNHRVFDTVNVFAMPNKLNLVGDRFGYYFSIKKPCHAFLGELISILQSSNELNTPEIVMEKGLKVFCRGHKFSDCVGITLL